ncbi:MAG: isoaspartyl peptidase/L-asparaginase [Bacteroidota bacterium]|nr:isoaspartyl peptidase/L-asparaginase [Bacteroidota bacterium]
MKTKLFVVLLLSLNLLCSAQSYDKSSVEEKTFSIVIHGGAGNITPENLPPATRKQYKAKLNEALLLGEELLKDDKSALLTVEKVLNLLEDSPLFNAGRGAVMSHRGLCEADASIMDGKTLNAGAVAGVTTIKNPISAARLVMDSSRHVLLSGEGANQFAERYGLVPVKNEYFQTERRKKSLRRAIDNENKISKHGTVGCVVIDNQGNIAAGTSTGGLTNKKYGRIGDSPILGAGTYADNSTCGISATGVGEYFIRLAVAHDISSLMSYKGLSLQAATDEVIQNKLTDLGGAGGVIGVDNKGNVSWSFNTGGMFRAYLKSDGTSVVKIFK